jgi:NAD(P)-dependent dehydrogenase (short-subunit alcohol dehydrogenase family)
MAHGRDDSPIRLSGWALILGASSGFGEATALALAGAGMSVAGVHLDRKATLPNAERIAAEVKRRGGQALFFNVNAADPTRRAEVLDAVERELDARGERGRLRVLLHSLAFGTLRPFAPDNPKEAVSKDQMDMTLDVMAHSLVYWTQDVVARGLMGAGGRIFAMTSGGGTLFLGTQGNFIGPGHISIFTDEGADWFGYHYYDGADNGASKYNLRRIFWQDTGWPSLSPPAPALPGDYELELMLIQTLKPDRGIFGGPQDL